MSKQDLKQPDAFQSTIELIQNYILENQKRFYAIVTAIILASLIAFGIFMYWSHYQSAAKDMYAKAQAATRTVDSPEAALRNIEIYNDLIKKYPLSWSARMAHYNVANIYFSLSQYDSAIENYKKFVSSRISDKAGIKFLALTSIGYCYEAKKDLKSALEYFQKAQSSNNVGFESVGYRNIGRTYEQLNDKKNALENYKKALDKTTDPAMIIFTKHKVSSLS